MYIAENVLLKIARTGRNRKKTTYSEKSGFVPETRWDIWKYFIARLAGYMLRGEWPVMVSIIFRSLTYAAIIF